MKRLLLIFFFLCCLPQIQAEVYDQSQLKSQTSFTAEILKVSSSQSSLVRCQVVLRSDLSLEFSKPFLIIVYSEAGQLKKRRLPARALAVSPLLETAASEFKFEIDLPLGKAIVAVPIATINQSGQVERVHFLNLFAKTADDLRLKVVAGYKEPDFDSRLKEEQRAVLFGAEQELLDEKRASKAMEQPNLALFERPYTLQVRFGAGPVFVRSGSLQTDPTSNLLNSEFQSLSSGSANFAIEGYLSSSVQWGFQSLNLPGQIEIGQQSNFIGSSQFAISQTQIHLDGFIHSLSFSILNRRFSPGFRLIGRSSTGLLLELGTQLSEPVQLAKLSSVSLLAGIGLEKWRASSIWNLEAWLISGAPISDNVLGQLFYSQVRLERSFSQKSPFVFGTEWIVEASQIKAKATLVQQTTLLGYAQLYLGWSF